MSKDSAVTVAFIGVLFLITAIATEFLITHPAAAAVLGQISPV